MDDFTRGALEMQRVAAEAMDNLCVQAENMLKLTSNGFDRGLSATRLKEMRDHYSSAATIIRAIKIQDTVSG